MNKNKGKKPHNNMRQRKPFSPPKKAEAFTLDSITSNTIGERAEITGIIDSIAQTSGPTLFSLTDGSGTLVLKGFEAPGERAYPDIDVGDTINAIVQINEFNGALEGEEAPTGPRKQNLLEKGSADYQNYNRTSFASLRCFRTIHN